MKVITLGNVTFTIRKYSALRALRLLPRVQRWAGSLLKSAAQAIRTDQLQGSMLPALSWELAALLATYFATEFGDKKIEDEIHAFLDDVVTYTVQNEHGEAVHEGAFSSGSIAIPVEHCFGGHPERFYELIAAVLEENFGGFFQTGSLLSQKVPELLMSQGLTIHSPEI